MKNGNMKKGRGKGMKKPMMKPMMSGGYSNQVIAPTYTYRFRFSGGTLG